VDVKFRSPTIDQVFKRISSICKIENVNIADAAVKRLIESSNNDMRFILNHLQMMNKLKRKITFDDAKNVQNDSTPDNVFQITTKLLNGAERPKNYHELMDCYFDDPQLIPLMVQQNYINYQSNQMDPLTSISKASESISFGDTINIAKTQDYSLSTLHAFYSTIQSSAFVSGKYVKLFPYDAYFPTFPSVLGKASTQRKNIGLLNSIYQSSMNLTSCSSDEFRDSYIPLLNVQFLKTLDSKEGIESTIKKMDEYHISKDDFVSMNEILSMGEKLKNKYNDIPTKIKTNLTRVYNKTHHQITRSSSRRKKDENEEEEGEGEIVEEESE
jgi:replication factor C subunit 1